MRSVLLSKRSQEFGLACLLTATFLALVSAWVLADSDSDRSMTPLFTDETLRLLSDSARSELRAADACSGNPATECQEHLAVKWSTTNARVDSKADAWITTKVKSALLTTEGVSATEVHVDTIDGLVTLYGSVPSASEKARAGEVARRVPGMRDVRNLLQVASLPTEKAGAVSDAALGE